MKIKVCGISDIDNLKAIDGLGVDHIGYNFYPPSKRYIGTTSAMIQYETQAEKIGVFVKETLDKVKEISEIFRLDHLQLHGDESVEYCRELSKEYSVIKVFRVDESFDFETVEPFEFCDYYLFDTMVSDYGGSGRKFNWNMLNQYVDHVPFILSGGIGPDDLSSLQGFSHPQLYGIDINSKFEISPGVKDVNVIKEFLQNINQNIAL